MSMNNLDKKYLDLVQDILDNGTEKKDRTGTGTISVFGRQIRYKMSEGFPLLTTKKMHWKSIVTELIWFLRGDTNIKYLVDNNCHIWDGDCYSNYLKHYCDEYNEEQKRKEESPLSWMVQELVNIRPLPKEEFINKIKTDDEFAKKWGELGPVYGKQWRSWGKLTEPTITYNLNNFEKLTNGIDQIANLINELKTNPDSRRLMVNAWNVGELDAAVLPPCHYGFQVYTRELSFEERWVLAEKYGYIKSDIVMPKPNDVYLGVNERLEFNSSWNDPVLGTNLPTRAISLMWNQRSVDTGLGLPFNIASYGLLLEIIAKAINMVPDELIGNLGDTHLYLNHIEPIKEQFGRELDSSERVKLFEGKMGYSDFLLPVLSSTLDFHGIPKNTREPFPLPTLSINTEFWPTESGECGVGPIDAIALFNSFSDDNFCKCLLEDDIQLVNYQSHPTIKLPLSN